MRYVHIIVSEGYIGCQRHSGCKDMCLESNKKNLRDDFDIVLEIPHILFFTPWSPLVLSQKREFLEFQEQYQNRP